MTVCLTKIHIPVVDQCIFLASPIRTNRAVRIDRCRLQTCSFLVPTMARSLNFSILLKQRSETFVGSITYISNLRDGYYKAFSENCASLFTTRRAVKTLHQLCQLSFIFAKKRHDITRKFPAFLVQSCDQ